MTSDSDILEVAIYVLSHKPDASMQEIADRAHVARTTLNRKFGNKKALLDQAQALSLKKFETVIKRAKNSRKPPIEKFMLILEDYYKLRNHYFFWMRVAINQSSKYQKHFLKQLSAIEAIVEEAQEQGDIRQDLPAGWVASFFDFLIITASANKYRGIVAERDLVRLVWETFRYGVSPRRAF